MVAFGTPETKPSASFPKRYESKSMITGPIDTPEPTGLRVDGTSAIWELEYDGTEKTKNRNKKILIDFKISVPP